MVFTGVAHVGITIPDMDRSVAFYTALLDEGPYFRRSYDEPYIADIVGYPNCSMEVALFRLPGTDVRLELLHYLEPPTGHTDLETHNVGNTHICFMIENWDAAYARLVELGAEFHHHGPVWQTVGEFKGSANVYLRDPDGITMELCIPAPE
jgi:catechol 2,3-dioxygenase-like lactoylglutathione lyase family enzyme